MGHVWGIHRIQAEIEVRMTYIFPCVRDEHTVSQKYCTVDQNLAEKKELLRLPIRLDSNFLLYVCSVVGLRCFTKYISPIGRSTRFLTSSDYTSQHFLVTAIG